MYMLKRDWSTLGTQTPILYVGGINIKMAFVKINSNYTKIEGPKSWVKTK